MPSDVKCSRLSASLGSHLRQKKAASPEEISAELGIGVLLLKLLLLLACEYGSCCLGWTFWQFRPFGICVERILQWTIGFLNEVLPFHHSVRFPVFRIREAAEEAQKQKAGADLGHKLVERSRCVQVHIWKGSQFFLLVSQFRGSFGGHLNRPRKWVSKTLQDLSASVLRS